MADKKTKEEETPQIKPQPKEKLLAFTVTTHFVDGNLNDFFSSYGYATEWQKDEVRHIPAWLAQRCLQSGADLERADG